MKKDNIRRNISLLMEYFDITSESQLARETGLGQATINKLVSGATEDPRLSTLLPIAEHYQLTLDTLVSDSPNFSTKNEPNDKKHGVISIPLISLKEINDIYNSLDSLHSENWPYWLPVPNNASAKYFAVKITKNYFPEPFNKTSTLICEKNTEIPNGSHCLVKHNNSDTVSIMKTFKEVGKTWLLSLRKELPATEFNTSDWTYLGTIKTLIMDVSNGDFFNFDSN